MLQFVPAVPFEARSSNQHQRQTDPTSHYINMRDISLHYTRKLLNPVNPRVNLPHYVSGINPYHPEISRRHLTYTREKLFKQ